MRQRSDDKYGRLLLVSEIRFAHAAVSRLEEPSPPLVTIYGAAGTGKTHLARHFVREAARRHPELRQLHITASEFTIELAEASKAKTIPNFQDCYRRLNLFVCEDLQALEGRKDSQQQLLAILDAVTAEGGCVLITSDRSPGEWSRFSAKLRNRCLGGVCAATELPCRSTREKYLSHFAEERGFTLSPEVAGVLAESLAVSARELRGVVVQLELLAMKLKKPVDVEIAQRVIDGAALAKKPTLPQITKVVARIFDVSIRDLKSPGRFQGLVLPRQIAMFAAREWTQQAYMEIGRYFGRRSHSTIVHACQKMRDRIANDSDFRQLVESIREQLEIPNTVNSTWSTTC